MGSTLNKSTLNKERNMNTALLVGQLVLATGILVIVSRALGERLEEMGLGKWD
jgi:hypothetical protein